jgi:hypothetical protein
LNASENSPTIQQSGLNWILGSGIALYVLALYVAVTSMNGTVELPRVGNLSDVGIAQVGTILWFYAENLSPYFLLMFYPTIKRLKAFSSPAFLVAATVLTTLVFLKISWYWHIPAIGADCAIGIWFLMRSGFQADDSFVLASLAVIGADAYYQIPAYVNWVISGGVWALQNLLLAAGFGMTSIPIFLYILLKITGRLKAEGWTVGLFGFVTIGSVIAASLYFHGFTDIYFMFPYWFAGLLAIAYESRSSP